MVNCQPLESNGANTVGDAVSTLKESKKIPIKVRKR